MSKAPKTTDQIQKKLHDAESRGHLGTEAAAAASGAALGALVGTIAGPPGAIAGAVVGGAIGALSGVGFDRGIRAGESHEHEIEEVEAEADRVIERRSSLPPPPAPPANAAPASPAKP